MALRSLSAQVSTAFLLLGLLLPSCAEFNQTALEQEPAALQTLEYYPYLVKGYQNTYPSRRILVLEPSDARKFEDPAERDHQPDNGNPAIGVIVDISGEVVRRLYAAPLSPLVQRAIAQAAGEGGLVPLSSEKSDYSAQNPRADYVIESRLTRCWVKKQRGADNRYGHTWRTTADFGLDIKIYKPPFRVPFWQGQTAASYSDPPTNPMLLTPEDQTGIYDEPGQVLSIALTRAVAGVFKRDDLRMLIKQDQPGGH